MRKLPTNTFLIVLLLPFALVWGGESNPEAETDTPQIQTIKLLRSENLRLGTLVESLQKYIQALELQSKNQQEEMKLRARLQALENACAAGKDEWNKEKMACVQKKEESKKK